MTYGARAMTLVHACRVIIIAQESGILWLIKILYRSIIIATETQNFKLGQNLPCLHIFGMIALFSYRLNITTTIQCIALHERKRVIL